MSTQQNLLTRFSNELILIGIAFLIVLSLTASAEAVGVFTRIALAAWFGYTYWVTGYWVKTMALLAGGTHGESPTRTEPREQSSGDGGVTEEADRGGS